jgi:hypothetical protein
MEAYELASLSFAVIWSRFDTVGLGLHPYIVRRVLLTISSEILVADVKDVSDAINQSSTS